MQYKVKLTRQARKGLLQLPTKIQAWAVTTIDQLADEPRPVGCKPLKGSTGYAIRRGDYRIVYEIQDNMLIIVATRAAHRKGV